MALPSLVIAFRGYCSTLQGEMAVIQGNSGLLESWMFMVPSNPGDFRIQGVWTHSQASWRLTRGRDLTGASNSRVPGGSYTIVHVDLTTSLSVSEGGCPRSGPPARIPVHGMVSGGAHGKPAGREGAGCEG